MSNDQFFKILVFAACFVFANIFVWYLYAVYLFFTGQLW